MRWRSSSLFIFVFALSLNGSQIRAELITHLPFDGSLEDMGPGGNHGFVNGRGQVPLVEGTDCDLAARFDGINFIQLEHNSNLPIVSNPQFSIAMWVKGIPQADNRVFSCGSTIDNNPLFNIGTEISGGAGTVDLFIRNGETVLDHVNSEGIAFDGTWHHIVFTYNEGVGELWIDGVKDPVDFSYSLQDWDLDTTTIGGILRSKPCCQYSGWIDDVGLYNHAVSEEEILGLYGDGPSPDCCPVGKGDTHAVQVLVNGPDGNRPGTYRVAALTRDDSGDPIIHTFTMDNGIDPPRVIGPQLSNIVNFELTEGDWRVTVSVDDDPECSDLAKDYHFSREFQVESPCPEEGDTTLESLEIATPADHNIENEYIFKATASDAGGDAIHYSFTITDEENNLVAVSDPRSDASEWHISIEPFEGLYLLTVEVDDDPTCDDPPGFIEIEFGSTTPGGIQIPGDIDQDGIKNLTDEIILISFLFLGNPLQLPCGDGSIQDEGNLALLDHNGDHSIDLTDAIAGISYQFLGTAPHVNGTFCTRIAGCPNLAGCTGVSQ